MLAEELYKNKNLSDSELKQLIETDTYDKLLYEKADAVRREYYGKDVFIRGLIEITNYCRCNCYYCGIRRDNQNVKRYRMTKEEILAACKYGYTLGFRTFVLQGGEDTSLSDIVICEIIREIKTKYGECAVTLSLGEKSFESYKFFFNAGADRYLLRHETANDGHYRALHPENQSPGNRKKCLFDLKKIGYQTGSGFMVGSPFQTTDNLIEDLRFLQELKPHMIGIGPYISHNATPFCNKKNGDLNLCLRLLAITRLMFPYALIPATTALGTIAPKGREMGLRAGANVIMPNLTPVQYRKEYEIYDNKISAGTETAEMLARLKEKVSLAGYKIVTGRGDCANT